MEINKTVHLICRYRQPAAIYRLEYLRSFQLQINLRVHAGPLGDLIDELSVGS